MTVSISLYKMTNLAPTARLSAGIPSKVIQKRPVVDATCYIHDRLIGRGLNEFDPRPILLEIVIFTTIFI